MNDENLIEEEVLHVMSKRYVLLPKEQSYDKESVNAYVSLPPAFWTKEKPKDWQPCLWIGPMDSKTSDTTSTYLQQEVALLKEDNIVTDIRVGDANSNYLRLSFPSTVLEGLASSSKDTILDKLPMLEKKAELQDDNDDDDYEVRICQPSDFGLSYASDLSEQWWENHPTAVFDMLVVLATRYVYEVAPTSLDSFLVNPKTGRIAAFHPIEKRETSGSKTSSQLRDWKQNKPKVFAEHLFQVLFNEDAPTFKLFTAWSNAMQSQSTKFLKFLEHFETKHQDRKDVLVEWMKVWLEEDEEDEEVPKKKKGGAKRKIEEDDEEEIPKTKKGSAKRKIEEEEVPKTKKGGVKRKMEDEEDDEVRKKQKVEPKTPARRRAVVETTTSSKKTKAAASSSTDWEWNKEQWKDVCRLLEHSKEFETSAHVDTNIVSLRNKKEIFPLRQSLSLTECLFEEEGKQEEDDDDNGDHAKWDREFSVALTKRRLSDARNALTMLLSFGMLKVHPSVKNKEERTKLQKALETRVRSILQLLVYRITYGIVLTPGKEMPYLELIPLVSTLFGPEFVNWTKKGHVLEDLNKIVPGIWTVVKHICREEQEEEKAGIAEAMKEFVSMQKFRSKTIPPYMDEAEFALGFAQFAALASFHKLSSPPPIEVDKQTVRAWLKALWEKGTYKQRGEVLRHVHMLLPKQEQLVSCFEILLKLHDCIKHQHAELASRPAQIALTLFQQSCATYLK